MLTITFTNNHGKPRWRVNVQSGRYRKRLYFKTREEAKAFAEGTGGAIGFGEPKKAKTSGKTSLHPARHVVGDFTFFG